MKITRFPSLIAIALFCAVSIARGQEDPQRASFHQTEANIPLPESFTPTTFISRVFRSLFAFSALFDDIARTTAHTDSPILIYKGAGTEAWGVSAFRAIEDDSKLKSNRTMLREGSGANSPKGYSLVEDRPRCYFTLGKDYCPAATNNKWTDYYMSYIERTSQVLTNAARMDPQDFKRIYNGNDGGTYKCSTRTLPPLRYSANAQQAALKESQMLADPNCPFQHDTCNKYCRLYGGKCNWDARISKYESNWRGMGENIAMTQRNLKEEPSAPVLQWLASGPHCSNIFSGDFSHLGTGAYDRYWTQDFLKLSGSTNNPLHDGTHYLHPAKTGGKLRFMASFKSSSAPKKMEVVVNGQAKSMSLHLGSSAQGLYAYEQSQPGSSAGCMSYYFVVTTSSGSTYNMPETGAFQTATVGKCTNNWIKTRNAGSGPAPGPAPAPAPRPVAPTSRPTRSPTRRPVSRPTRSPTRRPTRSPSRQPRPPSPRPPSPGVSSNPSPRPPSSNPSSWPRPPSPRPPSSVPSSIPSNRPRPPSSRPRPPTSYTRPPSRPRPPTSYTRPPSRPSAPSSGSGRPSSGWSGIPSTLVADDIDPFDFWPPVTETKSGESGAGDEN